MSPHALAVKAQLMMKFDAQVSAVLESAENQPFTLRSAEQATWKAILPVGADLLTGVLELQCRVEAVRAVAERGWTLDGVEPGVPRARLRLDDDYTAHLRSTFGPIDVRLFAVRKPGTSATICPARALFPHFPAMRSTDLLIEWECALAADHPFRKAGEALLFFTHGAADIEDTTIERHAVAVGNGIPRSMLYQVPAKIREILKARATRDKKTGRPLVYASTDAHALKRFVDDRWNPKWKMTNGIRLWATDAKTGKTIHLGGEFTWGDCLEVRKRFEWLQEQGILPKNGDYGEGVVAQVVLATDGLGWIADYVLPLYPGAVLVLDAYHVVHNVTEALKAVFRGKKNEPRVRRLVAQARRALGMRTRRTRTALRKGARLRRHATRRSGFTGSGQRLLDEVLRPLLDKLTSGKSRLKKLISYIERNLYRLGYADLRKRGIAIGSGAMESIHRTGSQVRLKRAGCHWTADAAQGILDLRMLMLSGRWTEYWDQARPQHVETLGKAA